MTISLPALVMICFGLFWLGGAVALWVFAFCTRGGKALSCINCERDAQFCRGCCDAIGPTPSAPVVDDAMEKRATQWLHDNRPEAEKRLWASDVRAMLNAALSGVSAPVGVEAVGEVRIQDGYIVSTSIKRPLADGGYDVVPQRLTPPAAAPSVSPAVAGDAGELPEPSKAAQETRKRIDAAGTYIRVGSDLHLAEMLLLELQTLQRRLAASGQEVEHG